MTNLTKIAIIARKSIRFGIYLIIIATIIRISFGTLSSVWLKIFPPEEPAPTGGYGPMPQLPFSEVAHGELSYRLETPDLSLPTFPTKMNVYRMVAPESDIQALPDAQDTASKLGFSPQGTELVESVYVFDHVKDPSKLKINIVNKNFSVGYDVRSNLAAIREVPPSPEEVEELAVSFLKRGNFHKNDISGPVKHRLLEYSNGNYEEAISLSEADVIEVSLFRKDFEDKYPSMPPDPNLANIWFRYSNPEGGPDNQLILAEYKYFEVNEQSKETYAILEPQAAWDKLISGNVTIVSVDKDFQGEIPIRNIYLAYYDPGKYLPFYQPIVVFEGDNNFVGYLQAVVPTNSKEQGEEMDNTDAPEGTDQSEENGDEGQ